MDRHWTLVAANATVVPLLVGVAPVLLAPSPNVLWISVHPEGLGSRIRNWHDHVLARVARQIEAVADPVLVSLLGELRSYPAPPGARPPTPAAALYGGHAVPLEMSVAGQAPGEAPLRLLSTTTVFGTAVDIGLSELAIESFFPMDVETAQALARMAAEA